MLSSPPGRGTAVFVALCALYQVRRAMPLADVSAPWDFEALFSKGYGSVALLVLFPSLVSLWGIAWSDLKRQSQGSAWLMLQAVVWALLAVVSLFKGEFLTALLMPWHAALVCSLQMHTLEPPLEAPVPPRAQPPPPTVRPATPEDQEAIAGLQEAAFARRPATFEPPLEGEEDGQHPVLVAEEDGRVVACASTRAYSTRECHAGVADFGLFVAKEVQGRGVDALLLEALLKAARSGASTSSPRRSSRTGHTPGSCSNAWDSPWWAPTRSTRGWMARGTTWWWWRRCCADASGGGPTDTVSSWHPRAGDAPLDPRASAGG